MANETRKPGRPAGRKFTHHFRVPMEPAMRDELQAAAEKEGRSAAEIVRELITRFLSRKVSG